jgi:pSer/pThr/pTyr-binding forkhead associated (FHA) protein
MWLINTEEQAESPFTFRILPGAIKTIGRAPASDFRVDAALVSRLHCRLTAGAAELEVVDLESTNGTFVNGARVDRAVLKSGDRLSVGKIEFVVSRAAKSAEAVERPADVNPQDADPQHLDARLTETHKEER